MLNRVLNRNRIIIAALALLLCAQAVNAQSTAFTYQGKLTDAGSPASSSYDIQFKLFDALTDGTQQGDTVTKAAVQERPRGSLPSNLILARKSLTAQRAIWKSAFVRPATLTHTPCLRRGS